MMSTAVTTEEKGTLAVRVLPPEEWSKLVPVYAKHGGVPALPVFIVVEDGGEIVGSVDVSLRPVVGLMHVEESRRGEGIASLLSASVESMCSKGDSVFTVTNNEQTAAMAERRGFQRLDGELWGKEF
jgi:GNAT superfamily N-acetyltransferase